MLFIDLKKRYATFDLKWMSKAEYGLRDCYIGFGRTYLCG